MQQVEGPVFLSEWPRGPRTRVGGVDICFAPRWTAPKGTWRLRRGLPGTYIRHPHPPPGVGLPSLAEERRRCRVPDVGVPLDVEVVEVVGVLHLAGFGALQPLDDLRFHLHGYVCRQQGEQQPLLKPGWKEDGERSHHRGRSKGRAKAPRGRSAANLRTLTSQIQSLEIHVKKNPIFQGQSVLLDYLLSSKHVFCSVQRKGRRSYFPEGII